MVKLFPSKGTGRKRRFIFFGLINVGITNICLQLMLLFVATGKATLISQLVNMSLGLTFYGKRVFDMESLNYKIGLRYFCLATMLWLANWYFIEALSQIGFSKNISAIVILPFLAAISFLSQKYLVFINR